MLVGWSLQKWLTEDQVKQLWLCDWAKASRIIESWNCHGWKRQDHPIQTSTAAPNPITHITQHQFHMPLEHVQEPIPLTDHPESKLFFFLKHLIWISPSHFRPFTAGRWALTWLHPPFRSHRAMSLPWASSFPAKHPQLPQKTFLEQPCLYGFNDKTLTHLQDFCSPLHPKPCTEAPVPRIEQTHALILPRWPTRAPPTLGNSPGRDFR